MKVGGDIALLVFQLLDVCRSTGKLLFDGKYLRDLAFAFDPVGHLPSWINVVR
jgi:hypothetical protein